MSALSPTADTGGSGELDLARRLRARDHDALRELHSRLGRMTFGYLVTTLGDRGAAEDVQQQVFLEVWQRIEKFDPGRGSLTTWVMTIARSRALDQLRRNVPEPRDPATHGGDGSSSGTESGNDIDEAISQWSFAELLRELPEEESLLLRYRFDGGLSQSEISEQTGIPVGTVKTRMANALARLRESVELGV